MTVAKTDPFASFRHPLRIALTGLAGLAMLLSTGCSSGGGQALSNNANLSGLSVSSSSIAFDPAVTSYDVAVGFLVAHLFVTPTVADTTATLTVAGQPASSGAASAVALAQGINNVAVVVTAQDGVSVRTYTLNIDREAAADFAQDVYVKASNTDENDKFGNSVALDGDTLAVGAPGEDSAVTGVGGNETDNTAAGSGAVYVFTRSAGVWTQEAYVKASNAGAFDRFGISVALDGDTLAVGAGEEGSAATGVGGDEADNSVVWSGAVYLFTRSAGVWSQEAYVKASNTDAADNFGSSVALDGDTLAVGAWLEDSVATGVGGDESDNTAHDSGAAYVFTRSAGVWTQQAYVKASNTNHEDKFGISVALDGDTLAVGAVGESSAATGVGGDEADDSRPFSGAIYVFTRSAGVWTQEAFVKASNTGWLDGFGISVALDGDTLAVGASGERSAATGVGGDEADNTAHGSGATYVFR